MSKRVYIDYENMANIKSLPKLDGKYFLFVGAAQEKLPKQLVLSAQENSGTFIEISGNGKNALDFHIAYQLGCDITSNPDSDTVYFILSKDSGFDPLVTHIQSKIGNRIFRIVSLDDIQAEDASTEDVAVQMDSRNFQKVQKHLTAIQKSKRPKSETKLVSDIRSVLRSEEPSDEEIKLIIDELYRTGFISKTNKTITYSE